MSDKPRRLSLSVKGLQRLEGGNYPSDFAFIVGDKRYPCPSFVAEFLSPRLTSIRSQDTTIDEFTIETHDPEHRFGLFLSIGFGRGVSLSRNDLSLVRSICGELSNYELFERTFEHQDGGITEEELKARLELLSGMGENCEREVPVVASHFHVFSVSDFDHLSSSALAAILSDSGLVVWDEDSVFEVIYRRASEDLSYFGLLEFVRFEYLTAERMTTACEFISNEFDSLTLGIWSRIQDRFRLSVTPPSETGRFLVRPIDSAIISTVPRIFSVFGDKKLRLLWRGSRHGFEGTKFHARCNGRPNHVTLVLTTTGSIFGGYTPLAWNSRNACASDPTMKSFIFTLKNPHDLPAQVFKQKTQDAIYDHFAQPPRFGSHGDLYIGDRGNKCNDSLSNLGTAYANETGIAGNQVLTGAQHFTLKEIEVFEVV
jgi:hypothetical protein